MQPAQTPPEAITERLASRRGCAMTALISGRYPTAAPAAPLSTAMRNTPRTATARWINVPSAARNTPHGAPQTGGAPR